MQQPATPRRRPVHSIRPGEDDRLHYFARRVRGRKARWWAQRLRRLERWERVFQPHPVRALQRLLTADVRAFGSSYYCVASQVFCQTGPADCPHVPHPDEVFYRAEVFTYLALPEPDPCVARVHCRTVRGLRRRVAAALTAAGTEGDAWGLAGITPEWRETLEKLILSPNTAGPTRVNVFRELLDKLNRNECAALAQQLSDGIKARLPGAPAYAVLHGLHPEAFA